MRLVALDLIKEGAKLGKSIATADGRVLLGEGVPLKKEFIEKLKAMGLESVYILDEKFSELEIQLELNDIISDTTRRESIQVTKDSLERIVKGKPIEVPKILGAVNNIIDDLLHQDTLLINLSDIRTFDDYTFAHSVNVAVLSLVMGIGLGYDQLKLRNLGVGALLHDLGKTKIALEILNKPSKLTDQEFALMQQHSEEGFRLIKENRELSILIAHVAYQHHERFDGTGYPRGLKGTEITKFARIVAIADVYDALTADRPYRKRHLPHEAYEYLMGACSTHFDHNLVSVFLKHVAPYPAGTIVLLNTGEKGVVVQQHLDFLLRPVVMVFEKDGKDLGRSFEYDLAINPTIMIKEVLADRKSVV